MSTPARNSKGDSPLIEFDRQMILRAVRLATKGRGRVEPNPMVGCVIAKKREVISEGWHRRFGGPHAEIEALRNCRRSPRGATLYVSLEPCCHHGKTPPCTDAIKNAGLSRVVFGMRDPHRPNKRGGSEVLCRAGIRVNRDVECEAARELIAPYLTRIRLRRPFVIAKWAQSLDGRLATRTGDSKWISGVAARRVVHKLRARVDAILVGSQTVIADDPMLTARDVRVLRNALRVVVDSRLRIPPSCRLIATGFEIPTLIFTNRNNAASTKARRLISRGVEIVPCRLTNDRLALSSILADLAKREVTNLLVEGGPTLIRSFLKSRKVDEAQVFTAPILIGGKGAPGALDGPGARTVSKSIRAMHSSIVRCGEDSLHLLRLTTPPS